MAKKQKQNNEEESKISGLDLEEVLAPSTPEEIRANKHVDVVRRQIKTSVDYKRARMEEVQKSIDLYNGKTKKALKGRWNLPLPLMSGYIDTLLSKTDDTPRVKFGYQDVADMQRAAKAQAKFDQDSSSVEGRWALKDRMEKKIAGFYGYAVSKIFAYNDKDGKYRSVYEVVDPLDFEFEPMGGQFLRDHKFKGQRNIFKTKAELLEGATGDNPIYSKKQVLRLLALAGSSDSKKFDKLFQEKTERLRSLGFNPDLNNYVGSEIYNFTEWYYEYDGVKYYMLLEPHSGIWIRHKELKEVFESNEDPFTAWHTHPDPFNFLSKSPADDMRPVAEGLNIIFNQALDNREKKNYGQRAYDPEIFTDPSQLEWRPDGLVEADTAGGTKPIGSGIYEFTIPDIPESGTINLMKFVDDITGLKTGVTASAQGESDEKRVGIYYGNLQQVADRLGLYNKSYSEAWGEKGLKYYWGLREHIKSNKLMVKMIGDKGYNWVDLVKEDLNPTQQFNIEIVGGQAQIAMDELTKKTKMDSLIALIGNQTFAQKLNPEVTMEEILRNGGWEDGQIKRFMDTQSYGAEELISEAHQAIEEILDNKKPKLNRGATTVFMQTLLDYATDAEDLDETTYQAIINYANDHMAIAAQNAVRKARLAQAVSGILRGGEMAPGAREAATPGGNANVDVPGSPTGPENFGFSETPVTSKEAINAGRSAEMSKIMGITQ